jgi:transporter family protein
MNWLGWALASALFAALTAILAKIGVAGVDATLATAVRTCVVLVFTWMMVWLNPAARGLSALTSRNWTFLALSGIATGLSWLCYFRALQIGQASRVAPIDKLSVALVILLGALVLGERLTWAKGIGGLLIVAGAIVIALERL